MLFNTLNYINVYVTIIYSYTELSVLRSVWSNLHLYDYHLLEEQKLDVSTIYTLLLAKYFHLYTLLLTFSALRYF